MGGLTALRGSYAETSRWARATPPAQKTRQEKTTSETGDGFELMKKTVGDDGPDLY